MIKNIKNKLIHDLHFAELLKGSSITFILKIITIGLGYVFTLLIARWYGPDAMGLYALSLTILNIFTTIGILGFDNALVKFVVDYNTQNKFYLTKEAYIKTLNIVVPFTIFLTILLYLFADFFANVFFKKTQLSLFLQIASLGILPLVLLRINAALFRGLKKIKAFSFFDSLGVILFSLIGLTFSSLLFQFSNKSIVITVQIVSIIFLVIICFIYIKSRISLLNTAIKDLLTYKSILQVSVPMLLASSLSLLMGWTDIIMLGIYRSESEVGVYSVVVKLAATTSVILGATGVVLGPKIVELWSKNDIKNLKNIIQQSTKIIFFTSFPILLTLLFFSKEVLLIFGDDFVMGSFSLIVLSLGQLFYAYSGDAGMFLKMTGNQIFLLKLNIFSSLLNIILNFILIKKLGIDGAAIATMTALISSKLLANQYILKKYGFNFYLRSFF